MKTAQQWWEVWLAMPTNTRWEDLVEAIRDEQRQACVKAYVEALRNGGGDMECPVAIRNAGVAPALKPGMLVVRRNGAYLPFVWQQDSPRQEENYRPLTRAEIDEYRERAP